MTSKEKPKVITLTTWLTFFIKISKMKLVLFLCSTQFWRASIPYYTKTVTRRCSAKKRLLKISQNAQENSCARVFFESCNFTKRKTPCEFCKICKNIFFIEHIRWLLLIIKSLGWFFDCSRSILLETAFPAIYGLLLRLIFSLKSYCQADFAYSAILIFLRVRLI